MITGHKRLRGAAWLVSGVAAVGFVGLGVVTSRYGEPAALQALQSVLADHATLTAWRLTWFGFPQILALLALALVVVAWRSRAWRMPSLFTVVMLVLCWQGATLAQRLFMRARPLDWVVKHETSFSYPSSHAAIAVGFYLLWAFIIARSTLRGRWVWSGLLTALTLGICWSRLVLGAHFVTDLVGGALLAVAVVSAGVAVAPINVLGRRDVRT